MVAAPDLKRVVLAGNVGLVLFTGVLYGLSQVQMGQWFALVSSWHASLCLSLGLLCATCSTGNWGGSGTCSEIALRAVEWASC